MDHRRYTSLRSLVLRFVCCGFVLCLFLLLHTWLPNCFPRFFFFGFFSPLPLPLPPLPLPCLGVYCLAPLATWLFSVDHFGGGGGGGVFVVRCCLIALLFVRRSRGRPELKSRLCRMDRTVWAGSTAMPHSRGPSFLDLASLVSSCLSSLAIWHPIRRRRGL